MTAMRMAFRAIIDSPVASARGSLERGESLVSFAFAGNRYADALQGEAAAKEQVIERGADQMPEGQRFAPGAAYVPQMFGKAVAHVIAAVSP